LGSLRTLLESLQETELGGIAAAENGSRPAEQRPHVSDGDDPPISGPMAHRELDLPA
jgi:hypothetical protein